MKTQRVLVLLLGFLTVWPVVYVLWFLAFFLKGQPQGSQDLSVVGALHLGTILLVFGLLIFYVSHIFRNERLDGEKRLIWVVVLFVGHFVAFVAYWYLYFWRRGRRAIVSAGMDDTVGNPSKGGS